MVLLWIVAAVGAVAGVAALVLARRTARRLASLTQSYWELRYAQNELRAVAESARNGAEPRGEPAPSAPQVPPAVFVPLSQLKRRQAPEAEYESRSRLKNKE